MQFLSKNFSMALSPYVLPDFYVVKIFVLKYFCRMSTLRTFFNTKIFPTKISYNENFRYMEIIQLYVLIVFNLVVHSNLPNLKPLPTFLDIDFTLAHFLPTAFFFHQQLLKKLAKA